MSVSEPGKIITPWAESGLKNPIPPAANPATGRAGFDQGFSAINMTAKEAGGIPPFGQDFNGIFYEVTNILRYMQAGGQPTFDASLAAAIGGYPKGAMVLGSDGVTLWQSKVDSNFSDPNVDASSWGTFDIGLKNDLAAPGGAGLVGGQAKPVTWVGFAGGADPAGVSSSVAAFKAAFEYGGDIYIPDGSYLIPGEGADAGGVLATITKSLRVACSPRAKFFTDNLDNDFIRIVVPDGGVGLPAEGITVDWEGGFFDQRNQRNSTVIPFITEYPPTKPGTSATCDGLSIRGSYVAGGATKIGIKRATARRVVTMAGEHWQSAGGDSGVFIDGCGEQVIEFCYLKGNRDIGAYASASESGQIKCSVSVVNNIFENCFHGASAKRGFESIRITKNTFINCVRAAQSEFIVMRNKDVGIYDNKFISCGTTVRIQQSDGGFIYANEDTNHGALLENGAIEPLVGLRGYLLENCNDIVVGPNNAFAENPAAVTAYPKQGHGVSIDGVSSGCLVLNNKFKGWRRLGSDSTAGGKNRWRGNTCPDGTAKYVTFADIANGSEERVADLLGSAPWYRTPIYFFTSDETAPAIRGYSGAGAPTAGIYFKGTDIGLAGPNVLFQGNLFPVTPNTTAIGAATSPVAGGWTQAAFTVTSDERTKTRPFEITDAMLDAVAEIDWVSFQIIGRILEKGEDSARWHVGVIAQRVKEALEKHGVDPHDHAFFCYDKWEAKPAVTLEVPAVYDLHGLMVSEARTEIIEEAVEAGDLYSIRYEELLVLKIKQVERDHERRFGALSARLDALESK